MSKIQEIDNTIDVLQALLWQYNNAIKLQFLIESKQFFWSSKYSVFWNSWYTDVFNLLTANDFGLAIWSIILNIPMFIPAPIPNTWQFFGFNEVPEINDNYNFDRGNFAPQAVYPLTTEEQRLVLRLRYYQLVSNGVMVNNAATIDDDPRIPAVNEFLAVLFPADIYPKILPGYGTVYVLDGLDMSITYVFNIAISNNLLSVLKYYDVLPRPAGVKVKYRVMSGALFGFNENTPINNYVNFERGSLAPAE